MAVTQSQIDALNAAIANGTRSVTLGGQTVTYHSVSDLIRARNDLRAQLNAQLGKRSSKQSYLVQSGRGFD